MPPKKNPPTPRGRNCFNCGSPAHLRQMCPAVDGKLVKLQYDPVLTALTSTAVAGKSAITPTRACFGCNSKKHLIRDCKRSTASLTPVSPTVAGKTATSPSRACYRCSSTEHLVRTCPFPVPEHGQGHGTLASHSRGLTHDVPVLAPWSEQHPVLSV